MDSCERGRFCDLEPVESKSEEVHMAFTVNAEIRPMHCFGHHTVPLVFCDFASAGNRWTPDNLYRVWLPKPLFLRHAFVADTWHLMYHDKETRPEIPNQMSGDSQANEHNEWAETAGT